MPHSYNGILHSTKKENERSIRTDTEKRPSCTNKEHQIAAWNTQ